MIEEKVVLAHQTIVSTTSEDSDIRPKFTRTAVGYKDIQEVIFCKECYYSIPNQYFNTNYPSDVVTESVRSDGKHNYTMWSNTKLKCDHPVHTAWEEYGGDCVPDKGFCFYGKRKETI